MCNLTREEILMRFESIYREIDDNGLCLNENMVFDSSSCCSVGLSSLILVTWLIKIEEEFSIEITEKEKSIKDVIDKIIETNE